MPIELPLKAREEAIASLKRYAQENMAEPLGNLAAGALLDFILEEIGPSIYNKAVADVQERLPARILELDIDLHQEEFPFWWRYEKKRKRR